MRQTGCELCEDVGGLLLWQNELCRVVRVEDNDYPGFCRVICSRHVREMSDLPNAEREQLMRVVIAVEQAIRETLRPFKMNLASLGNAVPHLHWHVIPRFQDDRHFPKPIWAAPEREPVHRNLPQEWKQELLRSVAAQCDLLPL